LRRWGYSVTYLNAPPPPENLQELLDATKPLLICAFFSPEEAASEKSHTESLAILSKHALCAILPPSPKGDAGENATQAQFSTKYYCVNSLLEFEILASRRAEFPRMPHDELLQAFLEEYK
jgi:hypothetical protein